MRDLYTKNSDKGGEGVQNPENLADVIYERPLTRRTVDDLIYSCTEAERPKR